MPGKVIFEVTMGSLEGQTFTYEEADRVFVGRQSDCGVVLPERTVSRYHCLLSINPPTVKLQDFGSLNGTYLNEQIIGRRERSQSREEASGEQHDEYELHDGDRIRLGKSCELRCRIELPEPAAEFPAPGGMEAEPMDADITVPEPGQNAGQAEAARIEAERQAEEARKEAEKLLEEQRKAEAARKEAERKAEEARKEAERRAEEARKEAERRAEEERKAEEARKEAERRAEEERKAEEARKEAERRAEEERKAEEARREAERKEAERRVAAALKEAAARKEAERKAEEARKEAERRERIRREAERLAEEAMREAQKRAEEARKEAERRAEAERKAEEARKEAERKAEEARKEAERRAEAARIEAERIEQERQQAAMQAAAMAAPSRKKCRGCGKMFKPTGPDNNLCSDCLADQGKVLDDILLALIGDALRKDGDAAMPSPVEGYTKVSMLGKGGMGEVWKVRENRTGKFFALKTMLPEVAADYKARQMFLREAGICEFLKHKNVVRTYQTGCTDGVFYILMDLCGGGSVDELMKRKGGKLSLNLATYIILQALDGLDYVHNADVTAEIKKRGLFGGKKTVDAKGVVHRDFKPANIFLSDKGDHPVAMVADFGMAKAFETAGLTDMSKPGEAKGTVPFMPRQQVLNCRLAKPEVDVWAAAASYYNMLTGGIPKNLKPGPLLWQGLVTESAVPIRQRDPSIPAGIAQVIDRALVEKPEIGCKSAAEFRRQLIAVLPAETKKYCKKVL